MKDLLERFNYWRKSKYYRRMQDSVDLSHDTRFIRNITYNKDEKDYDIGDWCRRDGVYIKKQDNSDQWRLKMVEAWENGDIMIVEWKK